MPGGYRLAQVRDRLARWRAKHGGRGIRVPEAMWAEVVEAARVEGVEATAHALQLDRARLAARMATAGTAGCEMAAEASGGFVELDAGRLGLSPRTVIRFQGQDGERLEVELAAGAVIDLALAEAFWRRGR
jgi:imidazolonepropionase-like amidohydrolase